MMQLAAQRLRVVLQRAVGVQGVAVVARRVDERQRHGVVDLERRIIDEEIARVQHEAAIGLHRAAEVHRDRVQRVHLQLEIEAFEERRERQLDRAVHHQTEREPGKAADALGLASELIDVRTEDDFNANPRLIPSALRRPWPWPQADFTPP